MYGSSSASCSNRRISNMKTISVIIPSFNSWITIGATIQALQHQTKREMLTEIIVVDSSDDLKTRVFLRELDFVGVRVIEACTQVMPARARNIGADHPN